MGTKLNAAITDPARLDELRSLRLLDSAPEPAFDRLTRLSARLLGSPVTLMSLIDDRRQFFKSAYGLPEPLLSRRQTPLPQSICQHVVSRAAPLIIEDARRHPLVSKIAAVKNLSAVAYLGIPLITTNGFTLGSFCAIDNQPRAWSASDVETLTDLANCVMTEIALRACQDERKQLIIELQERDNYPRHHVVDDQHLIDAIQIALRGQGLNGVSSNNASECEATADHPLTHAQSVLDSKRHLLTERQRGVFDLLMHGLQTKEVARQLDLSPRTVEVHRAHILKRLNANSFNQLIGQLLNDHDGS
jgi:DNA-binding CsgD family transcriptional regulator